MARLVSLVPDDVLTRKIYCIRGHKVMLDYDLAELYGSVTKVLKQSVRRNITRFPDDFMFELTPEEGDSLRSQIVTSNVRGGTRYAPMAFTEQGVAMLSSILNSEIAIQVNIQIIRVFTRMKEMLLNNKEILSQLDKIEKRLLGHDDDIARVFNHLKMLLHAPAEAPRPRVGFRRGGELA